MISWKRSYVRVFAGLAVAAAGVTAALSGCSSNFTTLLSGSTDFLASGRTLSFFTAVQVDPRSEDSAGPQFVVNADLNGDGAPDLAVANFGSSSVSVLLGAGDGSFGSATSHGVGDEPESVAIADLNGDGVPDLVVANSLSDSVSVLLGAGDGSFGKATSYGVDSGAISVAIADLDGNGAPDLAVANTYSNSVSVLLNQLP